MPIATDPILELLASLDPRGPTFLSDLQETLGVRYQTQMQDVIRAAREAGWPLAVHHAHRLGSSRGRNAVFVEGKHAEIEAAALEYWTRTYNE